jgi:hypothetical protein
MKRPLAICTLLLTLTASAASAQIQARWDDCLADGGAANKNSACDTDVGVSRLVISYTAPQTFPGFVAIDGQIDLQASDGTMPAWWDLKNSGACRETAASISIDASTLPNYSGACADTWDFGASAVGLFTGYAIGYGGSPTYARGVFAIARPVSNPTTLNNGTNYFGWIWQINNVNTTSCAGCLEPVVIVPTLIVLSSVSPLGNSATAQYITLTPDVGNFYDALAHWQNGYIPDPVRTATWGNVKALYR